MCPICAWSSKQLTQNKLAMLLEVLLQHALLTLFIYIQITYNIISQSADKTSQENLQGTIERSVYTGRKQHLWLHSQNQWGTKDLRSHNFQGTKCASWDLPYCFHF